MDANAWSLGCCSKEVCDSLHGLVMFKATADELRACADDMNRWLAEGQLNPQIGKTLPLSETAALTSISLTRLTREHVTLPACTAMRIAIGQLWQETNTLTPIVTARTDFELFGVCRGEQLVEQMATTNELGGFIQSLSRWPERPEIVGLARMAAWPSGPVTSEAFRWLQSSMLETLTDALPVDAVLLALHGAMVADGHRDVEGEILADARRRIGSTIPLVATLDLHANVTLRSK